MGDFDSFLQGPSSNDEEGMTDDQLRERFETLGPALAALYAERGPDGEPGNTHDSLRSRDVDIREFGQLAITSLIAMGQLKGMSVDDVRALPHDLQLAIMDLCVMMFCVGTHYERGQNNS